MKKLDKNIPFKEQVKILRSNTLKGAQKRRNISCSDPVAYWIKEERLLREVGKEFTVILRTRGCSWALGGSGCTMCGYTNDAYFSDVAPEFIIGQFDRALNQKLNEIQQDNQNYVFKLFNSGSFLDDQEINSTVREHIYQRINQVSKCKEVVVESRPEFITSDKLEQLKATLKDKNVEIGIGLETVNDSIRLEYINKGFSYNEFYKKVQLCNEHEVGVKVYLLFKPPFFNEQAAIDDCIASIKTLKDLPISTISINPMNVQKGTLVEYLWYHKKYRPPWFYSLMECIQKSVSPSDLEHLRIVSDPSGAGTKRGIHNCLDRSCNQLMRMKLKNFVLTQNLDYLDGNDSKCDCKTKYAMQKQF